MRRRTALAVLLVVSLAASLAAADVMMDALENYKRPVFYTNLTPVELAHLPVRTSGTISGAYVDDLTVLPWHEPDRSWLWAGQRQGSVEFLVKGRWNNVGCHDTIDYPASPQRPAVLFLGDSFVEAMQVDVRDTFYDRLRHSTLARRFDVWACGLAGGNAVWAARYLSGAPSTVEAPLGRLSTLRPAIVMYLVYMGNDLRDSAGAAFEDTHAASHGCPMRIEPGGSYFWFRARQVFDMYLSAGGADPLCINDAFWPYVQAPIPAVEAGWRAMLKGLDELNDVVREKGGTLIVGMIEPFPAPYGRFAMERAIRANYPGGKRVALDLSLPHNRLRDYAMSRGLDFVDLSDALRSCGGQNHYYPSDSHFNADGHRCVAQYLEAHQSTVFH